MSVSKTIRKPQARRNNESSWQSEKSRLTRTAILEAAIDCVIALGYTKTTTTHIAKRAGVSRGAMMHHFNSRDDVITAAVNHLEEKQLKEYAGFIEGIKPRDPYRLERHDIEQTIQAMWKFFNARSFIAYHELQIAARTDPKLDRILDAMQVDFEKRIADTIRERFPVWQGMEDTRELETDIVFFSLQGMALTRIKKHRKRRIQRMLDHLVDDVMLVYENSRRAARQ